MKEPAPERVGRRKRGYSQHRRHSLCAPRGTCVLRVETRAVAPTLRLDAPGRQTPPGTALIRSEQVRALPGGAGPRGW